MNTDPWGESPQQHSGGGHRTRHNSTSKKETPFENIHRWFSSPENKLPIGWIILAALFLWLASGLYHVDTDEQGVVLRFGKWVRTTPPGLHVHIPYPFEEVYRPKVTQINRVEIGYRGETERDRRSSRQIPEESLMLTGDENIVDINFTVFWRISDAGKYLFNIRNPEQTVKAVAESAMRDIIGQNDIEYTLTEGRGVIEQETLALTRSLLTEYGSGVEVTKVQLKKVDPPEQVIEAYRDVQRAKADQERMRNEAEAYRNDIIPRARGQAEKIIQEAEAYREEVVARANGDSARFLSVLKSYQEDKSVTTERIYIETLENVLSQVDKFIIDNENGASVIPYLPLTELDKERKRDRN
ncbi:MAG: FtsH protease activity modulator HflK [Alphaproteobacteria bacterium GM7ARS4]|nr:FtsH protease activity modulator HflK [Alphaproteobacteria bacterium GM7ARS4]